MEKQPLFFAGTSNRPLAEKISRLSGVPLGRLDVERFPDGEIGVRLLEEVAGRDAVVLQSFSPCPHKALFELMLIVDALKRGGAKKVIAAIPYMAYARQDHREEGREALGMKVVAKALEGAGVSSVVTMDLHSPQIEGFFDVPLVNLSSREALLKEQLKGIGLVVGPDSGSIKLARALASELKLDFAVVNKHRVTKAKVEVVTIIGDVKGKDVLLADDLCSTGETLVSAAKAIREKGANRVFAAVTHGLFVDGALEKIGQSPIEELWVSDTLECPANISFLRLFSVAPIFSKALFR